MDVLLVLLYPLVLIWCTDSYLDSLSNLVSALTDGLDDDF